MDEEQQLRLANRISDGLPDVTRSEWMRWTQIAHSYGLRRAIEFAGKLGNDVTLRPAIKQSNQIIASTMQRYIRELSDLNAVEQRIVIGYVSRILMVKASVLGAQKRKSEDRYNESLVI
jgi:hypothetical protein